MSPVQPGRNEKATYRLVRQPLLIDTDALVSFKLVGILAARLEVPEMDVSSSVAGADESTIRAESGLTSVPSDGVASVALLPVLLKGLGRVDEDLIVQRLHGEPFLCKREKSATRARSRAAARHTVGRFSYCGSTVHCWLCNVLDDDRNIEIPSSNALVIRSRHEAVEILAIPSD
jgi:hypothetical protein